MQTADAIKKVNKLRRLLKGKKVEEMYIFDYGSISITIYAKGQKLNIDYRYNKVYNALDLNFFLREKNGIINNYLCLELFLDDEELQLEKHKNKITIYHDKDNKRNAVYEIILQ